MNNLTRDQLEIIFSAVRKYQQNNIQYQELYFECNKILDKLYDLTYTQQREQVR